MALYRFLVAPDKFKGNLSAHEVADAMAKGIRDVILLAKIKIMPLADGGEGTGKLLSKTFGAKILCALVRGPLGKKVKVSWGLVGRTAYLDFASASGLKLISSRQRNPLETSSEGVGQLIREAVAKGAKNLIIGVGGSATVDGGIGAMEALGIQFLNDRKKPISRGGKGLQNLRSIDLSQNIFRGKKVQITLLCDVESPLLGSRGAAPIFGPQKGATPLMVRQLNHGLKNLDRIIQKLYGRSLARMPFGGAAGGTVAGFVGILGNIPGVKVKVVSGIDYVLDTLKIESAIEKVDWIFTGEGRLDSQTTYGKTIYGLARRARQMRKPVLAFAGEVDLSVSEIKRLGLVAAFSIAPFPCTLEQSFQNSALWIRRTVSKVVELIEL